MSAWEWIHASCKGIFIYDRFLRIVEPEIHVSSHLHVTLLKLHQILDLETSVCKLPVTKLINFANKSNL